MYDLYNEKGNYPIKSEMKLLDCQHTQFLILAAVSLISFQKILQIPPCLIHNISNLPAEQKRTGETSLCPLFLNVSEFCVLTNPCKFNCSHRTVSLLGNYYIGNAFFFRFFLVVIFISV